MPELQLAPGVCINRNITVNQAAREIWALGAGLANAAGGACPQRASLAHFALKPVPTMAALAGHV